VERPCPQPLEILCELLDTRLVADRRVRIGLAREWLCRINAALPVNLIEVFGLRVVRLKVVIGDGPGRGDAAVMTNLIKIPLPEAKERRPVNFGVAADVIVRMRVQFFAFSVAPLRLRLIPAFDVDRA